MKTAHHQITTFILAFFIVSTATVQAEDYLYETNNGTITITGYTGPGGDVTIPSTINGLSVTSIGDWAFCGCTSLTSITISDSVTSIGDVALGGCTSLTSVIIPDNVTSIGGQTFCGCTSLTSMIIPNKVSSIEDMAFYDCTSLASVTIGNSVTRIGNGAFAGCASLTTVTIPDSVTTIEVSGYHWYELRIPGAFDGCTSLTAIDVEPLNPAYSSVGGVLFNKNQTVLILCPGGKAGNYAVPSCVTNIGWDAFYACTSLTSITIPNSVTSIGWGAFENCTSLTSVSIPNSVSTIEGSTFSGCTSLTSITIPNSVTSIGDWTFAACTSLRGVYFKGNAPSVGGLLFEGDNNATVYYLPGTTGWGTTLSDRPTFPWLLPYPVILTTAPNFGAQNNAFGFRISWATNVPVVVEASTTLANPTWSPVSTNTLMGGWSYFSDAECKDYPARFYRVRKW